MMKRLRTPASTFILSMAMAPSLLTLPTPVYAEGGGRDAYAGSGFSSAAQREEVRRQTLVRQGTSALEAGDRAMKNKDYEEAWKQYRTAADSIPDAFNTKRLHAHAVHGLCQAGTALAEQRIAEGRYTDAGTVLRIVITDYDPGCREAITILKHLEDPDYYNKTITPRFRANVEQVKQWFVEARGYFDTGRFDMAFKRCEQILNVDPYNIAARKMQEEVNKKRENYAIEGYNQMRSFALWRVTKGWDMPVRRFGSIYQHVGTIDQGATGTEPHSDPSAQADEHHHSKARIPRRDHP